MAPKRSKRPLDHQHGSTTDSKAAKRRASSQSSAELNRNEEQISPAQGDQATRQWNTRLENIDRTSGRVTPPTGSDLSSRQGRNRTTGSNVPGSEIADRTATSDHMKQTSREKYPTSSSSSPSRTHDNSGMEKGRAYTGNSERTGQQYSEEEETSGQRKDLQKKKRTDDH